MAATVTVQATGGKKPMAPMFVDRIRVEGDNPYTVGGFFLDLATKLPGKTILGLTATVHVGKDWGTSYDRANDKLKIYVVSTGAEAGAIDLSTLDVELLVFSQ